MAETLIRHFLNGGQAIFVAGFELIRFVAHNAEASDVETPDPQPTPSLTAQGASECTSCGGTPADVTFSTCGHSLCRECFDHQITVASTHLTSSHFPLVCYSSGCQKPISIADLHKLVTVEVLDALMKASLTSHIRSNVDKYRNCRTLDCSSVYLRECSKDIITCPMCDAKTCVKCDKESHQGCACASPVDDSVNDQLSDEYKAAEGIKSCPNCATLIIKIEGCNHVECGSCQSQICWICLEVFSSYGAVYTHINEEHGEIDIEDEEERRRRALETWL